MADRVNCLCLIFEGPASSGKTHILGALDPEEDAVMEQYLYRTDKFTPASFLSHAADKTETELTKIDMLPRISEKLLVTPELSEMFGEEEHRLKANFATLTSVLDGKGQSSDSGAQGRRRLVGRYAFNWIGATTQIGQKVYRVMGTMGSRLLLFEFPDEPTDLAKAEAWLIDYEPKKTEDMLHKVMQDFILAHFTQYPVGTVPVKEVVVDKAVVHEISKHAWLIAKGRMITQQEGLYRLQLLLRMLVQGSAIIHGRYVVDETDLAIIKHVSISTIPHTRRAILRSIQARGMAHCTTSPGVGLFTRMQLDDFVSTALGQWRGNSVVIAKDWKWVLSV